MHKHSTRLRTHSVCISSQTSYLSRGRSEGMEEAEPDVQLTSSCACWSPGWTGRCSWCLLPTSVSVFRSAGAVTIPCRQTQKDRRNVNTVFKYSWLFPSFSPFLFLAFSHSLSLWVCVSGYACMVGLSYFYESLVFPHVLGFFFGKKILYYYESMLCPFRSFNRLFVMHWGALLLSFHSWS